jgi:hypothetical protein
MPRTEYRVTWLREGNTVPRTKKVGTSRKRAEAYLAAVCAATPEERYGDKVDKYKCCSGDFGYDEPPCVCGGKTWREHWMERFGGDGIHLVPVLWAKIEFRPTAPWEEAKAVAAPLVVYGDVLQAGDRKIVVIDPAKRTATIVEDGTKFGEHIGEATTYGLGTWEKVE